MFKKSLIAVGAFLLCLSLSACQQNVPLIISTNDTSEASYITVNEDITTLTESAPQTVNTELTSPIDTNGENTSAVNTTENEKTEASTEASPITASETEKPVPEWAETPYSVTLYVNTDGIYSRIAAIQGSTVVNRYSLNQAVDVIAYTNTGYCKIAQDEFIHKDYLSYDKITTTTTKEVTTIKSPVTAATTTPATTTEKAVDDFVGKYNQRQQTQWEIDFSNKVFELTNAERIKNGKPAYKKLSPLSNVATTRAWEILVEYRSDHTRPDGQYFSSAYKEQGIQYHYCGENIAAGQHTPEEVVEAWMNSQHHRDNILSDKFTYMGVGMYYKKGYNFEYYWCQEFCSLFE